MTDTIDWKARAEAAERERDHEVIVHGQTLAMLEAVERSLAEARSELAAVVAAAVAAASALHTVVETQRDEAGRGSAADNFARYAAVGRAMDALAPVLNSISGAARARDEAILAEAVNAERARIEPLVERFFGSMAATGEPTWSRDQFLKMDSDALRAMVEGRREMEADHARHTLREVIKIIDRREHDDTERDYVEWSDAVLDGRIDDALAELRAVRADKDGTR